jgi:hypothetical protein
MIGIWQKHVIFLDIFDNKNTIFPNQEQIHSGTASFEVRYFLFVFFLSYFHLVILCAYMKKSTVSIMSNSSFRHTLMLHM